MNFYENNYNELKKYRGNITRALENQKAGPLFNRPDQISSAIAHNKEKILILQTNKRNVRMNSSYDPANEAMIWADQFKLTSLNGVIVMYGLGNGIFAEALAKKLNKLDYLFIYEPSLEVFRFVMHHFDLTRIFQNRNIVICMEGVNDFEFHNLLQNATHVTNMFTQIHCVHPYYDELFRESYVKFWKEIKDTMVHTKMNINTEVIFGQRLINNGLKNLKYLKNSNCLEELLEDFNTDIPAIIVAAGPSLKDSIEELKKAKGKAYVFVVDRILDFVLDHGIEPDFVVTIDPVKPTEYFTTRDDVTIPLLCQPVSNYTVLEVHKGRKIMFGCNSFFQGLYKRVGIDTTALCTGASVATAAFALCVRIGFKRIVLVGQDLAFDGELSHAGGIAEQLNNGGATDIMVEGVDGNQVRTRYDWYEFLVWFKDIIILNPSIEVIDTKAKGAKIIGSVLMPLQEVIDTYCTGKTGIDEIMCTKPVTLDKERLQKTIEFFEDCKHDLGDITKKAKEAIRLCDTQLKEYRNQSGESKITMKNNKRLSKINQQIHEKPIYAFIDSYVTALTVEHIAKLYHITENELQNKLDTYEKSKIIYKGILDGVEFTEAKWNEAVKEFIHY